VTTIYTTSAALPYQHRQGAVAGLRAELRHLVELGYLLGRRAPDELPDWDTLVVTGPKETGPKETTDANGRVWFEYSATVQAHSPAERS
jgi:hypothetical protein